MVPRGRIVVVSGPSGSGKSTLVARLMRECRLPLVHSVSATTRLPRPGERDGEHYYFLAPEEFARRRQNDDFLECQEVFGRGHWYGTPRREVEQGLAAGKWVVLEIDILGMRAVLSAIPQALTVFVLPESLEELERRLRGRGTESEEAVLRRLEVARQELAVASEYQLQVVNDNLDRAVREVCGWLLARAEPDSPPH